MTVAASDKHGTGETNGTISCGGTVVRSGDMIIGDADGVTVVPKEQEEDVLKKALELEKLEKDQLREKKVLSSPTEARAYIDDQLL